MNTPADIQLIQKYLMAGFLEYGCKEYQDILAGQMFWLYKPLFEHLLKNWTEKTPEYYVVMNKLGNELAIELVEQQPNIVNKIGLVSYAKQLFLWYNTNNEKKTLENYSKIKQTYDRIDSIFIGEEFDIYSIFRKVEDEIEVNSQRDWLPIGYRTGIPVIDEHCEWIQRGTVMRISAYSNTGKSKLSYFMTNKFLKQWLKVSYFSLEVTPDKVLLNLISNYYGDDIRELSRGKKTMDFSSFYDVCKNNLEILGAKFSELSEIKRHVELKKPDIVIIDFIQNISVKWTTTEYERMTQIWTELQLMAIENNIALLDLSQISNEGFNYKLGQMIPSKGSGALVHSADVGIMLYKRDGILMLSIAKNKFGPKDMEVSMHVDFSIWDFKQLQTTVF